MTKQKGTRTGVAMMTVWLRAAVAVVEAMERFANLHGMD
jgi:hypothetical protein